MIFVDTGAWYASVVPDDKNHRTAIEWLAKSNVRLCTTDYIADETMTLLRSRGQAKTAITLGVALLAGGSPTSFSPGMTTSKLLGISFNALVTKDGVSRTALAKL